MKKKLLILLILLTVLGAGCINKPTKNIVNTTTVGNTTEDAGNKLVGNDTQLVENITNITEKEKYEKEDWYMSTYEGPSNITNSENARMSIIPHLRELGWNGGINVLYGKPGSENHTIVIVLPFQFNKESMDYINQTLSNYSYVPLTLNEKVVNK